MGSFDDKVVVITGAGGGIGRAHALYFARAGAKVVVNDLGGARDGSGEGQSMADAVVREIERLGGEAIASYDSVSTREGAEAIVGRALSRFGRIDVLVNNAGILRDKTMLKMSEEMFDSVIAVHLKGTWLCTQAAARAMVEQGDGGAIVNTTSVAGLLGNFGQTNYSAAKAGIYGVTLTAAQELRKHGIAVNAVAPIAKTRMTEDLAVVPEELKADHISPVVAFLASDPSRTGVILGAHGEHVFAYEMQASEGARSAGWTVDELTTRFAEITGDAATPTPTPADAPEAPAGEPSAEEMVAAVFQRMPQGFVADQAQGWQAVMHWKIAGAGDYTVAVDGGVCTTAPRLAGTPTCEVTTDRDTFLGMVDGTVDGQQAFMQGKVTATNLADMMKYRSVFSKEKAQAATAEAPNAAERQAPTASPASSAPAEPAAPVDPLRDVEPLERVHWIFRLKNELFPGAARPLRFELTDDGEHTLGERELGEGDFARVRCDSQTLCAFLAGDLDVPRATADLSLVTSRMKDLIWFRDTLRARRWEDAVAKAVASRPVSLTAAYREKVFTGAPVVVSREHADLYARATDDDNAAYAADERWPLVPPMLAVRYHHELAKQALTDPGIEVSLLRLVFGEQEMVFHAPLRVGDVVSPRCELASVEHKDAGSLLRYRFRLMREGELVNETWSTYFVRGDKRGDGKTRSAPAGVEDPTLTASFGVREDQSRDYAKASLDDNPIHVDENVAKAAGFKGIINHGLGTLALAARTLVDEHGGRDPTALHRVAGRFSAPVFMGDRLTVRAAEGERDGERGLAFEVRNQDDELVVTDGFAVLHPRA